MAPRCAAYVPRASNLPSNLQRSDDKESGGQLSLCRIAGTSVAPSVGRDNQGSASVILKYQSLNRVRTLDG
jgi:hypothetical protein